MSTFQASSSDTRSWKHFDYAVDDMGIATLTFNRPE